jgi:hypothetical protein
MEQLKVQKTTVQEELGYFPAMDNLSLMMAFLGKPHLPSFCDSFQLKKYLCYLSNWIKVIISI